VSILSASTHAIEEAIIKPMLSAEDMMGRNGLKIEALPHDRFTELMKEYR